MYVCGPTVYGLTHVGNARPAVFFDVVRRYLQQSGFRVIHITNFTDVDDRIIARARQEKTTSKVIAEKYCAEFIQDMAALKVLPPDVMPKVTEHMDAIVKFIEGLIQKRMAYVAEGGEVYYSVRNFKPYGKLSGKKIDELLAGARVEPTESKRDPLDFSLWKPQKQADEPAWDSPWGKGRPGWHIECSAMAMAYLGESFDIHGGGIDLLHPHHENEIAQSEGLTGKPFCKYWLHVNLVTTNAEKMSKSIGNIFLNRDFVARYSAEALKYLILSGHYRSPIDFSEKHIRECQAALHRIYTTLLKCERVVSSGASKKGAEQTPEENAVVEIEKTFKACWQQAMEDDLNTAKTVGQVFEYVRAVNAYLDRRGFFPSTISVGMATAFLKNIAELAEVLNLFGENSGDYLLQLRLLVLREQGIEQEAIEREIERRTIARQNKDYAAADEIRKALLEKGIELRDSPEGTQWDVVFKA